MAPNNSGNDANRSPPRTATDGTSGAMRILLHSEIVESHTSHGVSQEDYAQYAAYCTRRLSRLRHGKAARKELLRCRAYKCAHSTKVDRKEGGEGGSGGSKSKHAYRAVDLTNVPSEILASHANFFWEPLYCAERCWAASLAIRAEGNDADGGGGSGGGALGGGPKKDRSPGKIRALSIKKLRKAAKFATLLEQLTTSTKTLPSTAEEKAEDNGGSGEGEAPPPVDEHTRMEAGAYASWMRGNLALEQGRWREACDEYQAAVALCELLASGSNGGIDNANSGGNSANDLKRLELLDFFTARARNVIAPLLRYCHYELQEKGMSPTEKISFLQSSSSISDAPSDLLQSKLHSLKAQTLQNQATSGSSMSQIVFRGNTIAVETKEVRMALLKIQDLTFELEEDKKGGANHGSGNSNNNNNNTGGSSDAKFMALLSGYDDAISLANQELRQLAALKPGPAVNAKRFQLVNIVGYCRYQKLMMVMGRNEAMADDIVRRNKRRGMTLKHLEEAAHLYDALLQDAREVASIPGGGSPNDLDGTTAAGTEDEFLLEANANVLRLRALRCYYLARMHASPLVGKYSEALALLDQAEGLGQEAAEEIGACDGMVGGEGLLKGLENVLEKLRGEKCRALAASYLVGHASLTEGRPLLERLHEYDIPSVPTAVIAHVPPKLEPMACKPSFFDVALNYVGDYPAEELDQALEENGDGKSTASRGFLGWFRR